ncbi:hypothetical protein [Streptomyces sp. NBC_01013]|uniref:hypothetical protein n=1 Tax=Streptomyces sp. NBC_01013 TaxID=2903718 RepID=UPI0038652560|nr:hypothetical protein OG538_18595 [Streptomyces sp. NBC_01013]
MAYLRSFLPWIAVSVLVGTIDVRYALLAGLVLALALIVVQRRAGGDWAALVIETGAALYFAVCTTAAFAAPDSGLVTDYSSAGSSLWLALLAWGSLAIGKPFTRGIARTTVPAEHWDSPLFRRVNTVITAVWAAAFTIGGAGSVWLHHAQPDNSTARTVLTVICVVVPILFTVRYPEIARARSVAAAPARPAE